MRLLSFFIFLVITSPSAFSSQRIQSSIEADLLNRKTVSFESILAKWKRQHGNRAVYPLWKIAKNPKQNETHRYIALMGLTRLGGRTATPMIESLLRDRSWMIRSGALQAIRFLGDRNAAKKAVPLLNDKALVVRNEAVATLEALRPEGALQALLSTLQNKKNFHRGRAQWVPQRVLRAITQFKTSQKTAEKTADQLLPLLNYQADPELLHLTFQVLEKITGKRSNSRSLSEQTAYWKRLLKR